MATRKITLELTNAELGAILTALDYTAIAPLDEESRDLYGSGQRLAAARRAEAKVRAALFCKHAIPEKHCSICTPITRWR